MRLRKSEHNKGETLRITMISCDQSLDAVTGSEEAGTLDPYTYGSKPSVNAVATSQMGQDKWLALLQNASKKS